MWCQESKGTEICGRAHHKILHGSNSAYVAADFGWGTPRGPGKFRPALFAGRPVGSLLTAGTAGAIFEIVEAPVLSVEGRKVPGIVFTDSGSDMNFITHNLAQQLQLGGAHAKIRLKSPSPSLSGRGGGQYRQGPLDGSGRGGQHHRLGAIGRQSSSKTSLPRNPGAGGETADRSSRLVDFHDREAAALPRGQQEGEGWTLKNPLGCGQVLTGVAEIRKEASGGERLSAECRAPQGETAA